ncbi:protein kinase, partial [Streptomyces sp. HSW2009]|uniref:serine/threonine-protein kinase n=1 Tax=Streptomyces sp. HSW2009 TaxID=3142890 RepID=UPI0032EFA390
MADTRLIQGRYQLLDLIGRGGMGEVWRARDTSLGRHVAVKCLKPIGPQHDASYVRVLRERFRREAQVAASLQHRGVTVVHDFGESEGVLYLVMELLDGRNLSQLLDDSQPEPLAVADTVDIAQQVSAALAYTHRQGIVHRDLKPANIMRLTDGTVKICDFGIARLGHDIGGLTSRLTGTGIAMGTPHYMSPEQIAGGLVDHRSDLYSLGCVLYELATGAPPFDHEDAWAVLVGHRDTPPEPLRDRRPELPATFAEAVLDLLAKDPEERPADAATLATRIAGGTPGESTAARRVSDGDPPASGPGTASTTGAAGAPTASGEPEAETEPPAAGADLPSWARHMTIGSRATGAFPAQSPPDGSAGLTGAWTGPQATARPPAAGAEPKRPTPPPGVLDRLAIRHHAGLSFARLGRWEEAGEVHRAVAAEREQALGPDHPDTLASRYEIAFTLGRLDRPAEALHEYGRVAEGRARSLGPDHPDTLAARQETAYVLSQLGRHLEAHEIYGTVLAARTRVMGPDHPDTLRCRHNLAFNLSRRGRLDESYRMAREVATARARVLGALHPDTLVTRYEVAYALGQLGRSDEALHAYREVAAARAAARGAAPPAPHAPPDAGGGGGPPPRPPTPPPRGGGAPPPAPRPGGAGPRAPPPPPG